MGQKNMQTSTFSFLSHLLEGSIRHRRGKECGQKDLVWGAEVEREGENEREVEGEREGERERGRETGRKRGRERGREVKERPRGEREAER